MSRQMRVEIRDSDLAVIGLSCRFPGAPTPRDYWRLLRDGREGTRLLDDASLIAKGIDRRIFSRADYVRVSADIPEIEWFDAAFFGSSPAEAEMMDPQHRLFLETAWHALEDAALDPSQFDGPIACFAGKTLNSYIAGAIRGEDDAATSLLSLLGNDKDYLATQVSYKLDLRGPSATVQTACSTSLVAIHLACQSLLNGECDAAIAGGVSIRLPSGVGYLHQAGMVFSSDGKCRAFDAGANGMLSGSGVGVVVIRRAVDAIAAGDPIRAIIRGTAVNNDGARKVGFTAPSVDGQAAVVAEALAVADVDADTLSYIEAHGTGTPLGDPIEIAALTRVLGDRPGSARVSLGSVKTNFGHLDAAAGVAGLIKTILALQHRQLPPTLHFTQPNPEIDFNTGRFDVQTTLSEWAEGEGPRRAGVSSFGIGGTNAHAVLQEAPPVEPGTNTARVQLMPLSARSTEALTARSADLEQHLGEHRDLSLADVAWTLQSGRRAFEHRRAIVASTVEEARAALAAPATIGNAQPRSLVFMFPGQGSQYVAMARGLSAAYPHFRDTFDRCLDLASANLGADLRAIVWADKAGEDLLRQTRYAQPALFAVEYSLASLLMKWLGRPAALIGHSVGEYAAASLAGVFSLEDAISLVVERGRLMQSMPSGSMLAVAAAESEIARFLDGRIELAAVNGPSQCVVAGPADAIGALESQLASSGIACHLLKTSHAFHSASMDAAAAALADRVAKVSKHAPKIPVISNVTGLALTAGEAVDPQYWARQLRTTVRFADGVRSLMEGEHRLLIEVGPGTALHGLVRRNPAFGDAHVVVAAMRQEHEDRSDEVKLLEAVGQAWVSGAMVDWKQLHGDEKRQRLSLPVYSFVRQRYWREPGIASSSEAKLDRIDLERWCHVPGWKRVAPRQADTAKRASSGEWIVVADDQGPAVSVIAKLRARGLPVTVVSRGDSCETALVNAGSGGEPLHIVHALALRDDETFDAAQESGFYGLLDLARTLSRTASGREVRLTVLSNGVYDVTGVESLDANHSTLIGAVKVIPQEHPQVRTRHVDLQRDVPARIIVDALIDERLPATLAIRGSYVWEQTFDRIALAPIAKDAVPPALRANGVYLLTGGFGAIGFTLARYLAKRVRARLVLVSRGALSDRHAAKVRELEDLGAEVLVIQADVADESQMRVAIGVTRNRFGVLHGVIHVAGERHTAAIDDATREICEAQFRSKVYGTVVLDRVLADESIDFCQVVSSMATVLGGIGLSAYTAAHCFADAFVQQHNRTHPVPWTTVNWDNWLSDDGSDQFAGIEISSGHHYSEGVEIFERIEPGLPQVLISTVDLQARIARWIELDFLRDAATPAAKSASLYERPQLASPYVAPGPGMPTVLTELWQELLQIDRIGIHDNFFELGGDSVISIRFLAKAARVGIRLSTRDVFERQTIAQLCAVALATGATAPGAEQGVISGDAPLTPMQHWLVDQNLATPSFFNQAMVYETPLAVEVPHLRKALQALVDHHDGLRLGLIGSGADRRQRISPPRQIALQVFDLSRDSDQRQRQAIGERIAELHRGLDLAAGDIVRFAYFDVGQQPGWLAIIVHHTAIDGFAWRIISEDLQTAYQQSVSGKRISLPEKTTSALAWSRSLEKLASDATGAAQVEFWTRQDNGRVPPMPRDLSDGLNTAGSVETFELALDEATTAGLGRVARDYETRIEVLIEAALARTLARFTGSATAMFDCEGHGRDGLSDGVDLSRTVAWCTAIYPIVIALPHEHASSVEDWIRAAIDQAAAIPDKGATYGVLRHLGADAVAGPLRAMPDREVVHCHLGQLEAPTGAFKPIHQQQFLAQNPDDVRRWLLEADTVIYQGRLVTLWRFSKNIHRRETIDLIANDFLETLRAFVSHVPSRRHRAADFPQADLDQEELDELVAELSGGDEDEL